MSRPSSWLNPRFVSLWAITWALALTALIPLINAWTPLLGQQYENYWTLGLNPFSW